MTTIAKPVAARRVRQHPLSAVWAVLSSLRADRVFLAVGIPFGLLLVALSPPFQVPDEPAHYFRAYAISNAQFFVTPVGNSTGNILPASLKTSAERTLAGIPLHHERRVSVPVILEELGRPLEPGVRIPIAFMGAAVYFPIVYAPQAAGMWAARVLGGSPLWIMYGGRLTNLIVALLLTGWAIRITPIHGWMMALLALSPMVAYTRSSLSADALTNALAFLLVAIVLREALAERGQLPGSRIALIVALSVLLGLSKLTYVVLSAAVLLIPRARFGSRWQQAGISAGVVLVSAVPVLLWGRHAAPLYRPNPVWRNPGAQLQHLLEHPWTVLKVWLDAPVQHWEGYVTTAIGRFGWLDTPMPNWVIGALVVLLFATAVLDSGVRESAGAPAAKITPLSGFQRFVCAALAIAGVYAVIATLYVAWTRVGHDTVEGVQGRYFLPVFPLLFLALHRSTSPGRRVMLARGAVVAAGVLLSVTATTLTIYTRYFG